VRQDAVKWTIATTLGLILACGPQPASSQGGETGPAAGERAAGRVVEDPPPPSRDPAETALFVDAARLAWDGLQRNYREQTGLFSATEHYDHATPWDIASGLAATFAAKELQLITAAEYDRRMERMLSTLERLPLYQDVAFHRIYSTTQGRMSDRTGNITSRGYAWSATDIGRLLIWLKIVAVNDPQHADRIQRIVQRQDYRRIVRDGYLIGEDATRRGAGRVFNEGRIGYEQYSAAGLALWGHAPEKALDVRTNARSLVVLGVPLLADGRGLDRLLSEPFVMMGLELGWDPQYGELARNVLRVQEERYRRTGQVTIVSEDAVNVPPNYFYYYCVYCNGRDFVIDTHDPGRFLDSPRWVSTKNTWGWHALLPGDYTRRALETIEGARSPNGWYSGVLEGDPGRTTDARDVNTAAVILTAALYRQRGGPILLTSPGWTGGTPWRPR
jgi:hypothetical protein